MQNTIQKFNTKNQNYLLNSMSPAKPLKSPEVKADKKEDNSKALWGSLAGLAAIGGGIWVFISRRGSVGKQTNGLIAEINSSTGVISEKYEKLKKLVLSDYTMRRNRLVQDLNKFDEFDYKIPFKNGRSLKEKISILENEYTEIDTVYSNNVKENLKIIRNKLKELSTDAEWLELRKLRKQFMQIMQNPNEGEQRRIASEKITFINDLLINKVYPKDKLKYNLYGITDEQALDIVRKKFATYDEFTNYYDSMKTKTMPFNFEEIGNRFSHNGKLSLMDIFPEEIGAIRNSANLREETFSKLEAAKSLYNRYITELKKLAEEYRKTDGMRELKTLILNMKSQK